MDYKGQQLSEQLYYYIVIIFGVIAWFVGYVQQSFLLTVYGWSAGVAISVLLCVPDWPWYRRNPIKWLESIPERKKPKDSETTDTKKKKKQ
mmetsp:Transcript_3223/g.4698  ORF Transcript_3223/g.4698 Transcript_3223/m.4698 type:complete len:91 (+) Transcript_3223:118-390(+)